MADDANFVQGNDDGGDDPVRELLTTCDRTPPEGLAWIDRLDDGLKAKPMIMFARFIALRHLAIDGFSSGGASELGSAREDVIARIMDGENRAYADQALAQVADLEARHPGYLEDLGDPSDRFGERMVDDICIVNERLQPGKVQEVLGWTKLSYFGSERLRNMPGAFGAGDDALIRAAIRTRMRPPRIARSAVCYAKGEDGRRRYLNVFLMEKDFRTTPNFGEAIMFCSARIFDDGALAFGPMEFGDATPARGSEAPRPAERAEGGLFAKSARRLGRWLVGP